jgi:hypothetical protein
VSAWHGHYCLHLDAAGFPCNRPTMRLGMCDQHREAKPQKRRREREAAQTAGLAPAFEGA